MPKWTNKGHEFDELGELFKKTNKILIIGSQDEINCISKKLEFLNTQISGYSRVSDFDLGHNLKKKIKLLKIKLFKNKYKNIFKNNTILISNSIFYNPQLRKLMNNLNLKENVDYFREEEFFNKYLSIFAVYVSNKVYFPSNCFICTTMCSLNCRDCLNFAPYDKKKEHYNIQRLKDDIDTYFKCVDRVGFFHISGGEPFSYPHLKELIEYIHNNYNNKIETLAVVTNMTIIPSDELCKTLKDTQILIQLDDYTETNIERKQQYQRVLSKLKSFNTNYSEIVAGTQWNWVSLLPPQKVILDEKELIRKYQVCGSIFQELKNKKISACCYSGFSTQAGFFDYIDDEYFDLESYTQDKKKELIEFRLKYNTKGYVEFCKYCNGLPPYNSQFIKPAVQTKGYLEWDKNNPLEVKKVSFAKK